MKQSCPELARLGRNVTTSPDPAMVMHMRRCPTCQAEWSSLKRLTMLAGALPDPPTRSATRAQARARLVASAANVLPRREAASRRWARAVFGAAIAVGAAATAVAVVMLVRPADVKPPASAAAPNVPAPVIASAVHRGDVQSVDSPTAARSAARFTWSGLPDEVVRLAHGTVSIRVARLHAHERFRVLTSDAEIEAHGTAFNVTAANDKLVAVAVDHGLVEVRPTHGRPVLLGAAQKWETVSAPPGRAAVAMSAAHEIGRRPHEAHEGRAGESAAERGFAEGWRALRAQDFANAAVAFGRAAEEGRNEAIAEDALYWQSVALARAERPIQARAAMTAFLARYPGSPRTGEISAMLGWLLVRVDDDEGARRHFSAALHDRAETVRGSARSGLAALDRRAARAHK